MNNKYKYVIGFIVLITLNGCRAPDSLAGYWFETTSENSTYIGELYFNSDGTFGITWEPFETYVDYWGTYTYDKQTGRIKLTIEYGNYIPNDTDLDGYVFENANEDLEFYGMYFGTPQFPEINGPKPKTQTFSKQ